MKCRQTQMRDRVVNVISKHPRMRVNHEIDVILPWLSKRIQMLQGIDKNVLMEIVSRCDYLKGRRDDVVIRQGDRGDCFFIILTGTVGVYIDATKSGEDDADDISMSRSSFRSSSRETMASVAQSAANHLPLPPTDDLRESDNEAREKARLGNESVVSFREPLEEVLLFDKNTDDTKDGKLDRAKYGKFVIKFEEGRCFGEIAMISEDNVRNATIICEEETDFMVIHRNLYNETLKSYQEREFLERRVFANKNPLFKRWSSRFKRLLEMSLIKETYSFDTHIIRQGEPWDGLIFIHKGRAQVVVEPGKHEQQYNQMLPFLDHNDTYELEQLRPSKSTGRKKKSGKDLVASLQQGHVSVRRREGYAAAEKRRALRDINICTVAEGEVFGDTEMIMGMTTYMQTVTCTTATEVFILTPKNVERLIAKKNPSTMNKLKYSVETKMRSRLDTVQGNQVPLFKHIYFKMTAEKRPQPKTIPPLRSTKDLPDKEILFEHLLQSFKRNQAELVEPYVPGAIYLREMMREKAQVRENIREQQKHYKKVKKPTHRRSVKLPAPKHARTIKQLKMALTKQQEESEDLDKRMVLHEIRQLEEEMLKRDYEKQKLLDRGHPESKSDPRLNKPPGNGLADAAFDFMARKEAKTDKTLKEPHKRIETEKPEIDMENRKGEIETAVPKPLPSESPLPPILRMERTKTFITELTESEPGDLQAAREGGGKDTRDVQSAQGDYATTDNSDDGMSKHPVLPPIARKDSVQSSSLGKSVSTRKDVARMHFLNAFMSHRLQAAPENPSYRDWETSDRSMRFLEERVKLFSTRTGEVVGQPPPVGLPKLQRFHAGEEEAVQPHPGGKVFVRRKKCALADLKKKMVNHEHVRYRMVGSLPEYDRMRRNKMMMQMVIDDVREKWIKAQPKS